MSKKKEPKKKIPKGLSQKERFIEYARKVEADESGETFDRTMGRIIKPRN